VYGIEAESRLIYQPFGGARTVLHEDDGKLRFLRCDQQSGRGRILVLQEDRNHEVRSILGWDIEHPVTPAIPIERRYLKPEDLEKEIAMPAANDEAAGMSFVYRDAMPPGPPPELVVTPRNGMYLVSIGPEGRNIVPYA
jgi:hypothetical protein